MVFLLYDLSVVKYDEKDGVVMRCINDRFITDLRTGCLAFFLEQVKLNRDKLSLEIRDGYINIYYKGGNLLKITQKKNGYSFHFDARYCFDKGDDSNYEKLNALNPSSNHDYIDNFELMMSEMESWLKAHPKKEREFQHDLLVNNSNIIDIEYATPKSKITGEKLNMRLDMLMVERDMLIIVENKYGIGAISGNAGVKDHYDDICKLLNTPDVYDELVQSVLNIAKAKYELGLIDKPIENIYKGKTEILFLFADFNQKSDSLKNEIKSMPVTYPYKILFMDGEETIIDFSKVKNI